MSAIFRAFLDFLHPGRLELIERRCATFNRSAMFPPDPMLGYTYLTLGLLYQFAYVPCVVVMCQRKYLQYSCYQIMLMIGIIDIVTLCVNSDLSGYLSILGAGVCDYPVLVSMAGKTGLAGWCGYCAFCCLLAFNRCFDLLDEHSAKRWFSGWSLRVIFVLLFLYMSYFFFIEPAAMYYTKFGAWFFDIDPEHEYTPNTMHSLNNLAAVVLIISAYVMLVIIFMRKVSVVSTVNGNRQISTLQRQVLIQSVIICSFTLCASALYVLMQFMSLPLIFLKISQFSWQFCNGGTAYMYLIMNRSIRHDVIKLITCNWGAFVEPSGKDHASTTKPGTTRRSSISTA